MGSPYMGPMGMDPYYPSPPIAMGRPTREPMRERLIAHPFQVCFVVSLDLSFLHASNSACNSPGLQFTPYWRQVNGKTHTGPFMRGPRFGNDVRGDLE